MKNLTKENLHNYDPDLELYSVEELAKFNALSDHDILLNFKKFLEASFPYLVNVRAYAPESEAWINFCESTYAELVYGIFNSKYVVFPFHKYGFHLHCYRKINHIECFICEDEINVLNQENTIITIKSEALKYIGLAFIGFTPEKFDRDTPLNFTYLRAEIFDRETGYGFNDNRYQIIYIPLKDVRAELILEDYDEAEHKFYKENKTINTQNNEAFKNGLIK